MSTVRAKAIGWGLTAATIVGGFLLAAPSASASVGIANIHEGYISPAVGCIQSAVNDTIPGQHLKVDGDFGPATLAGVEAFQRAEHLSVDGVVGPLTGDAIAAVDDAIFQFNCYNWLPTTR